MNEHYNVGIVQDVYLAFRVRNISELLNCLAEDVKWFSIGPSDIIPIAGERRGRDQVKQYFSTLEATEEFQDFKPQEFIAEGDKVVAIGELESRVKATRSVIKSPWVHVFTLREGKISEFRSFYDTAAAVTAHADIRSLFANARKSEDRRPAIL